MLKSTSNFTAKLASRHGVGTHSNNALLATGCVGHVFCENDYQIMANWFWGITLNPVYPVLLPTYVAILGGAAGVTGTGLAGTFY